MLVILLTLALSADDAAKKADPPAKKELFAKEDWYTESTAKEEEFKGTLRYKPRDTVSFGRYNPFTLEIEVKGKKEVREVFVQGKDKMLKEYAGKKVKFTGKYVETEIVGKVHKEIWPARVELDDK